MSSRLTAMEIESQSFGRKWRGYDPSDVDLFLRSVSEEVQRLSMENGQLREETGRLKQELQGVRSREDSLQKTLVTAQRMTDEMRERAGKESELLVREARLRAEGLLRDAQDRLKRLDSDINRSRLERDTFERRLRGVLEQHLALLDMRREASPDGDTLRVLPVRVSSESG
jgi:cell division initiation protein